MPGQKMNSIKNKDQYEALRDQGMSKSKAAAIANSSNEGESNERYEKRTKDELYDQAREVGIEGRSRMSKQELIEALRSA